MHRLDHRSCGQGRKPFAVITDRARRCTANVPFQMNSLGRGSSPLVLPDEKQKLPRLSSPVCPYSQGLEIPTYFWGNMYWHPALSSSSQLSIPSTNMCSQDSIQRHLREFISWKASLITPNYFFPSCFV